MKIKSCIFKLLLTLMLLLVALVPAMANTSLSEEQNSSSIVQVNGTDYDLSKLTDVKKYFEESGQLDDLIKNHSPKDLQRKIEKIKNDPKIKENPDCKKYLQILNENQFFEVISDQVPKASKDSDIIITPNAVGTFNLETKLNTNSAKLVSIYNATYNLERSYGESVTVAAQDAFLAAAAYFANNEKEGAAWDYKSVLGWNTYYSTYIDGTNFYIPGEDIGNIHYGYVGSTYFSPSILLTAGGIVQFATGTSSWSYWDTYWDDPNDSAAIRKGINYYEDGYFH